MLEIEKGESIADQRVPVHQLSTGTWIQKL